MLKNEESVTGYWRDRGSRSRNLAITFRPSDAALILSIVAIGFAARLAGIDWLLGVGITPDFSFHPDENRFVIAGTSFPGHTMWGGYVVGQATQLYLLLGIAKQLGFEINALVGLRSITLLHAGITIAATYLLALTLGADRRLASLAGSFVALSPLHVLNSNFGTTDVSYVSLFYLSALAAAKYFQTSSRVWFATFVASVGFTISLKFFIPLLVALALIVFTDAKERRLELALSGAFILAGSFAIASFFNYTPWSFVRHLHLLLFDNAFIVGGNTPWENMYSYAWALVPSLSIPLVALVLVALASYSIRWLTSSSQALGGLTFARCVEELRSPLGLLAVVFSMHGAMMIVADLFAPRHLLVYVPALAILAASGLLTLADKLRFGTWRLTVTLVFLTGYLAYNIYGLQTRFSTDVRVHLQAWTESVLAEGARVYALSFYSAVRGVDYDRDREAASIAQNEFLVTCDSEFRRYLRSRDADEIFHPFGGQARTDFFRDVLFGESHLIVVESFEQTNFIAEQRLIQQGWLPGLGTFTPQVCLALGGESSFSADEQAAVLRRARGEK